ncbi:MAG: hypothetical protein WC522_06060 [Candidatus Omnitrophota bacterium]
MPAKKIQILNFDNSVAKQKTLLSRYRPALIDMTGPSSDARFWISRRAKALVEKEIQRLDKRAVTFLGSGDFHHISSLLINRFEEPVTVISFDFHPDWDIIFPSLTCGSWITHILRKNNIPKVILLGTAGGDISTFYIQTGNLDSLENDRVEVYPYAHPPTRVFAKRIPSNISIRPERGMVSGRIHWSGLKDMDLDSFMRNLVSRIPTEKVYVSIDKDCLRKEYALTNWEEGKLSLEELISMLKAIKENRDIAGLDITGDYSDISINKPFKNLISLWDHPRSIAAMEMGEEAITAVNEDTNLKILAALEGAA